jgi:replicative DNA helicase Mcm
LTALVKTALPEDVFQDFFRSFESDQMGSKYRKRLAQVAVANGKSVIIDFDDLISFDPALARRVVEKPDDYLAYASSAATAQMRVEDPEYAKVVGRILARFSRLPEKVAVSRIRAEHFGKLIQVDGVIVGVNQPELLMLLAVFRCRRCLETIVQDQEGELLRGPGTHCPFCKQHTSFELLEEQSRFVDVQRVAIGEHSLKGRLRAHPLRRSNAELREDLVDSVRVDDVVESTAIVRVRKPQGTRLPTRISRYYLEINNIKIVGDKS